jgi:TatD DNase family protein
MRFIDTHAHIYLKDFDDDIDSVIQRAFNEQIGTIILPNIDSSSISSLHKLTEKYPDHCFPLMGLHPTSVKGNYKHELNKILSQFDNYKYHGVGEIGIDLYWDKNFIDEQISVFEKQLSFALKRSLPVVIHARDSFDLIFKSIAKTEFAGLKGIFHAFTGNEEQAKWIINKGFKIGIGGIVTFKNSAIAQVVKSINLEHIVLETDSPYLTPAPYRGKRNETSYLKIIGAKIAEIKGISLEEVAEKTTENAVQLFALK